jgi:hypothetical protein
MQKLLTMRKDSQLQATIMPFIDISAILPEK